MAAKRDLAYRLKEARLAAGLSQKALGMAAGIDQFVASARVNRYEQGVHEPDTRTAARLAKVLQVPVAYLYCEDDELAKIIVGFSALSASKKADFKRQLEDSQP